MALGQEFARAAEPGLDFVEHQRDDVVGAQAPHLGEVARGRDHHPGLALDGLDQERHRMRRYGGFERRGIAERHHAKPRREGAEIPVCLGIGAEPHDSDGTAVEVFRRRR